jgi:hypothetical protein
MIALVRRDLKQLAPFLPIHALLFATIYSLYRARSWAFIIRSSYGLLT